MVNFRALWKVALGSTHAFRGRKGCNWCADATKFDELLDETVVAEDRKSFSVFTHLSYSLLAESL